MGFLYRIQDTVNRYSVNHINTRGRMQDMEYNGYRIYRTMDTLDTGYQS